jgi:hypothetical protein
MGQGSGAGVNKIGYWEAVVMIKISLEIVRYKIR